MQKLVYGVWAGKPNGTPEDTVRCIQSVHGEGSFGHERQCRRKRGHGRDGMYFKQHAKYAEPITRQGG